MTSFFPFPPQLHRIDYLRSVFHLCFREDYYLGPELPLRLRRDLQRAERYAAERGGGRSFPSLLASPLPQDPVALRRFQKPGPSFVLHPSPDPCDLYRAGACWRLPVLFIGRGVQQIQPFHCLLQALGELGLHKCSGRFDIVAVEAENASGQSEIIWHRGENKGGMPIPISTLGYWLQLSMISGEAVDMTFLTPARLISANKPLFHPNFSKMFPFILRRVTSLLYACSSWEVAMDSLLHNAAQVQETDNTLAWMDWRTLDGGNERVDLGGVTGSVALSGEGMSEILWILLIGSLFNLGKGASYGAGHYELKERV